MKKHFFNALLNYFKSNKDLFLLTGDIGFGIIDEFMILPNQFLNTGVAEQNMLSMAAGMAHMGLRPIIMSIGLFPTIRALEQLRNDICYHDLNVKIVVLGAGVSYGTHGYSHWAIEDLPILAQLPHLTIASPSDLTEGLELLDMALSDPHPWVIRLGHNPPRPLAHEKNPLSSRGNIRFIQRGHSKKAILAQGVLVFEAQKVLPPDWSLISAPFAHLSLNDSQQSFLKSLEKLIVLEEQLGTSILSYQLFTLGIAPTKTLLLTQEILKCYGKKQEELWKVCGIDSSSLLQYVVD